VHGSRRRIRRLEFLRERLARWAPERLAQHPQVGEVIEAPCSPPGSYCQREWHPPRLTHTASGWHCTRSPGRSREIPQSSPWMPRSAASVPPPPPPPAVEQPSNHWPRRAYADVSDVAGVPDGPVTEGAPYGHAWWIRLIQAVLHASGVDSCDLPGCGGCLRGACTGSCGRGWGWSKLVLCLRLSALMDWAYIHTWYCCHPRLGIHGVDVFLLLAWLHPCALCRAGMAEAERARHYPCVLCRCRGRAWLGFHL
jgi:hypothetical protein